MPLGRLARTIVLRASKSDAQSEEVYRAHSRRTGFQSKVLNAQLAGGTKICITHRCRHVNGAPDLFDKRKTPTIRYSYFEPAYPYIASLQRIASTLNGLGCVRKKSTLRKNTPGKCPGLTPLGYPVIYKQTCTHGVKQWIWVLKCRPASSRPQSPRGGAYLNTVSIAAVRVPDNVDSPNGRHCRPAYHREGVPLLNIANILGVSPSGMLV